MNSFSLNQATNYAGIVKWPTSWKGKALLTGWVMYALIVDWGMCALYCIDNLLTFVCHFLAYIGNLVASLTKPARTKALDTFEDTLDLPEEASVVVPYGNQAIIQFMKGTSDPILKVCSLIQTCVLFGKLLLNHDFIMVHLITSPARANEILPTGFSGNLAK